MNRHEPPSVVSTVSICLLLLLISGGASARPTTPQEAILAVSGWLTGNTKPFDVPLGDQPLDVRTITGPAGEPAYYIVRLHPSGFVIVPADDSVEPILAFTSGQTYGPTDQDPLTALVTADLSRRLANASAVGTSGRLQIQSATDTQVKWRDLIGKANSTPGAFGILSLQAVSDVRVAPFLQTHWAQGDVCSQHCFNYFTPGNSPCGCAATAMAQLMYHYRCPAAGVGQQSFTIQVLNQDQSVLTRGGNGAGGPYGWTDMVLAPDCNSTAEQRAAIGALCYDAGVALGTTYTSEGSGANAFAIVAALQSTFGFSNGINGANNGQDIGTGLIGMINPNLDAQYPVLLGILGTTGHAVLVDGYGYDLSTRNQTLYHHLNMGWSGYYNVWYNLPQIGDYDSVLACIYNVFPNGTGEIVSGRITDSSGQPLAGVTIKTSSHAKQYQAVTNDKGIYALAQLPSASSFTLQADKPGFTFPRQTVQTGTSRDWQASAGNQWGIDFVGTPMTAGLPYSSP